MIKIQLDGIGKDETSVAVEAVVREEHETVSYDGADYEVPRGYFEYEVVIGEEKLTVNAEEVKALSHLFASALVLTPKDAPVGDAEPAQGD